MTSNTKEIKHIIHEFLSKIRPIDISYLGVGILPREQLTQNYMDNVSFVETCLRIKSGQVLRTGDVFIYKKHDGYKLPDFIGVVLFDHQTGSFGYVRRSLIEPETGSLFRIIPFNEHHELQSDLLNHIEVICSIYDEIIQ